MGVAEPFFHIYSAVLIVLLGFVVIEVRRLRKNTERK